MYTFSQKSSQNKPPQTWEDQIHTSGCICAALFHHLLSHPRVHTQVRALSWPAAAPTRGRHMMEVTQADRSELGLCLVAHGECELTYRVGGTV